MEAKPTIARYLAGMHGQRHTEVAWKNLKEDPKTFGAAGAGSASTPDFTGSLRHDR